MLSACSLATTLHFDEFGTSPLLNVDGMHVFGVTFQFSPGFADYNGQIGTSGSAVLVSDPLFTGPTTGTLTLAFDTPRRCCNSTWRCIPWLPSIQPTLSPFPVDKYSVA